MEKIRNFITTHKRTLYIAIAIVAFLSLGLFLDFSINGTPKKNSAALSATESIYDTESLSTENTQIASSADTSESKSDAVVKDTAASDSDTQDRSSSDSTGAHTKGSASSENTSKNTSSDGAMANTPSASTEKQDQYHTDPVPEGKPAPVELDSTTSSSTVYHCTISISCATILNNMELCNPDKVELIPSDGWILKPVKVSFTKGENVYDVLQRVCKDNGIHMESSWTPMYNSAYVEGIYNIYEFDVGNLSGWMYKVDDWFPNYGCSRYELQDGQTICWEYTCDLGYDVGGGF